jgi:hypothetical protein
MKKLTLKGMILAAIFAALTGILTQIQFQVPLSPVPITWRCFRYTWRGAAGPRYARCRWRCTCCWARWACRVFQFTGGLHK